MSGKVDTNILTRPKSSSQIVARKKRICDAWVGVKSRSPTEISIQESVNDISIKNIPKTPSDKINSTAKLLENTIKVYESTTKTNEITEKNLITPRIPPETTPEIQSKTPEKTPEAAVRIFQRSVLNKHRHAENLSINTSKSFTRSKNSFDLNDSLVNLSTASVVQEALGTDAFIIKNIERPIKPNAFLSPKSSESLKDFKKIAQKGTNTKSGILDPKTNIVNNARTAFYNTSDTKSSSSLSPKSLHNSPSRYGNKKSYDLDDEKMEILKQKQNNWPWAYRLTDKYSSMAATHRRLLSSGDIQNLSITLPARKLNTKETCVAESKYTDQRSSIIKAALEREPEKSLKYEMPQRNKDFVENILETEDDERSIKNDDKIKDLQRNIDLLREKEEALQCSLKRTSEKHQIEVKNYNREIALKDKKIIELTAAISVSSELQTGYKSKIEELEKNIEQNVLDSKKMITRQGIKEIDNMNNQIRIYKNRIQQLENEKEKEYENSNKLIIELDETIKEKEIYIEKLAKELSIKDKKIAECDEIIRDLESQISELKSTSSYIENPTETKILQEKLNSSYKANSELTVSLRKETAEKEVLVKKIEINEKYHKDEVGKLRLEIERLRKMIKEKNEEKKYEDYEREKNEMQDTIHNLTEMMRIKDDMLNRREVKLLYRK